MSEYLPSKNAPVTPVTSRKQWYLILDFGATHYPVCYFETVVPNDHRCVKWPVKVPSSVSIRFFLMAYMSVMDELDRLGNDTVRRPLVDIALDVQYVHKKMNDWSEDPTSYTYRIVSLERRETERDD